MTDIDNPVFEQRHSDPSELKHTDTENNEQTQSYEKVAPKTAVENSTHNSVENAVTEESVNGYTKNEEREEKEDPPSPPKEQTSTDKSTEKIKDVIEKVNTTTKKRKVATNPFVRITPTGALSFIFFTSYFSLLDALCYLTFYSLLFNLLHVLSREQLQKFLKNDVVNPFEKFLSETPVYIDRTTADKYINICINGINYLLLEGQQIALIDDPMRSFKAYLCNKTLVDQQLEHILKIVYDYWDRFVGLAKHHTKGYFDKVQPLMAGTGLFPNNKTTEEPKEE
ncbi:3161_t:CDS:2 [Cetraspora pellucida]|uniref:3161_t:CDS:1 n=1 Tax=Cetraspora pellucida TaxID=1433469 RepID=A0A9N9JEK9_9GLOM|nr:3161_t:CDS:2 [Cetraspora pellucida]